MTTTPLCTVKYCPSPSNPDWHACIVCGNNKIEHAHVESRARNPARRMDKKNIVALCVAHHREVDERQNGTHSHHIREIPGKGRLYFRMDLHGKTLFEKVLEPWIIRPGTEEIITSKTDTIKSGSGSPAVEQQKNSELRSRRADNSTAELPAGAVEKAAPKPPTASAPAGYDEWARAIKQLARGGHTWQFSVGDAANIGEAQFGEEAWQTLDELGIQPETLSNIMRVCKAIPLRIRNDSLKYSHYYQVYKLAEKNPEEAQYWLRQAEENNWNIREFKDALREEGLLPPRKTVKRWDLEELRRLYEISGRELAQDFLRWLGAQDD